MTIDKSLNQAPLGLDGSLSAGAMPGVNMPDEYAPGLNEIEIEIEDPEEVTIRAGDMELEIDPDEAGDDFSENLAETLDEDVLVSGL